jgi:heptosyltransferase II
MNTKTNPTGAATRPLIVRLRNFVGDAVLGVPALHLLQRHGYSLQLVGKPWARDLFAAEGWPVAVRPKGLAHRVRQLRALREQARAQDAGFDQRPNALVLPWAFSAALDMRLAGLRADGYAYEARGWLLARSHPMNPNTHALRNYWDLACAFLGIQEPAPLQIGLAVGSTQQAAAADLLAQHALQPQQFVLVCPFASGTTDFVDKSWPAFPAFVRQLVGKGHRVVVCPGPSELEGARRLYPDALCLEGVGLGAYSALMTQALWVVANDTGPAHLAAAVGAPLLSVLGPTNAAMWAPWGPLVQVLQLQSGWPEPDAVLHRLQTLPTRTSQPSQP